MPLYYATSFAVLRLAQYLDIASNIPHVQSKRTISTRQAAMAAKEEVREDILETAEKCVEVARMAAKSRSTKHLLQGSTVKKKVCKCGHGLPLIASHCCPSLNLQSWQHSS